MHRRLSSFSQLSVILPLHRVALSHAFDQIGEHNLSVLCEDIAHVDRLAREEAQLLSPAGGRGGV